MDKFGKLGCFFCMILLSYKMVTGIRDGVLYMKGVVQQHYHLIFLMKLDAVAGPSWYKNIRLCG